MESTNTLANALLDGPELTARPTSTNARLSHVNMVVFVLMASTNTHANALLDTEDLTAKLTLTSALNLNLLCQ
jgi:hypothetical protein